MEGWPPELAQYVAYDGWLDAKDIMSLCCASQAMCEMLLGDEYAQKHFKAMAPSEELYARKEYDAMLIAMKRKRLDFSSDALNIALGAPDSRLIAMMLQRGWFNPADNPRFIYRAILGKRYVDIVLENVDMDNALVRQKILSGFCKTGNVERVKHFVERFGIDTSVPGHSGMWLLHWACCSNSVELVKMFIHQGVDTLDNGRFTAFKHAYYSRHVNVFEYLLKHHNPTIEISVNGPDTWRSSVYKVIGSTHSRAALAKTKLLFEYANIDVNNRLLHRACLAGHENLVAYLLQRDGINVNDEDQHGNSALYYACHRNREKTVAVLLADPRVDINHNDHQALQQCLRSSYRAIFDMFLANERLELTHQLLQSIARLEDAYYLKALFERFGVEAIDSMLRLQNLFTVAQRHHRLDTMRFLLTLDALHIHLVSPEQMRGLPQDIQQTMRRRFGMHLMYLGL